MPKLNSCSQGRSGWRAFFKILRIYRWLWREMKTERADGQDITTAWKAANLMEKRNEKGGKY